jgi:hypothetical protein
MVNAVARGSLSAAAGEPLPLWDGAAGRRHAGDVQGGGSGRSGRLSPEA